MLFKYKGLSNVQFALDIFVNKRLYAADFKSLNDPMEGHYTYQDGTLEQWQVDEIFGEKNRYRILSLSAVANNLLMWSYYCESHTGMVVGVEVRDKGADKQPIDYVDDLGLEWGHGSVARRILSKKYRLWAHERETRVFVIDRTYVKVQPCELIFGVGTKPEVKDLVSSVARRFCPKIKISTMKRENLDFTGNSTSRCSG